MVIGRLLTDENFRERFASDAHRALSELLERGVHLTHAEIAALVATDQELWGRVAEQIDPRLQKVSVTP
ncbi:MAG TPA: Os1348 family NHLP clan protein [Vicinamibacterales bacterium]|nr:Os1348 family NHLP clan protein [Vicinamibacterales bacterium]